MISCFQHLNKDTPTKKLTKLRKLCLENMVNKMTGIPFSFSVEKIRKRKRKIRFNVNEVGREVVVGYSLC